MELSLLFWVAERLWFWSIQLKKNFLTLISLQEVFETAYGRKTKINKIVAKGDTALKTFGSKWQ